MSIAVAPAVRYSPVGAALASEAMRSYNAATQWTDADQFVGTALQSIASNPTTTPDEKALANLGWQMGNHQGMQFQNSAQARDAALAAIAGSTPGSIGHVMAVVGMNAYGPANKWPDADEMTGDALLAIAGHPMTTAVQDALAQNAWNATNVAGEQYQDSAVARYQALQQLAQQP